MSVGERVRLARKEKGISQELLASAARMSQPALSELESGASTSTSHIASLAAALGISALYLETGKGLKVPGGEAPEVLVDVIELITLFKNAKPDGRAEILRAARGVS